MLINALIQLGLSEKEASVYLMLLRVGPSPVSSLSKRLNLNRATLYGVLDSLEKRGYVSKANSDSCRVYIPLNPECILNDLEEVKESLEMKMKVASECVSRLKEMSQHKAELAKSHARYLGEQAKMKLFSAVDRSKELYILISTDPSPFLRSLIEEWLEAGVQMHKFNIERAKGEYLLVQGDKVLFFLDGEHPEISISNDSSFSQLLVQILKKLNRAKMG